METNVNEIADGIYRLSTLTEAVPGGFTFNQFLVNAEQPLLFHTGLKGLFPSVSAAVATVVPVEQLRWVSFGHWEADESGALNQWLEAAPSAELAVGTIDSMLSGNDQAIRPPRSLADGEVLDLGGKRVRWIDTPHVPHGWDAGLLYEETTGTLLCGDLFTQGGDTAATDGDIVGPAAALEDMMSATSLTPRTAPTIRGLADLQPSTLALMHGPSFAGDCAGALRALADDYEVRLQKALAG
ncbi:MAG TPA: MBL fold metallo-hydrolase [Acidimicrobiales bacterium]|jgi:flavorubredoxin|nr:MBL fold metallo-hydrolase [Acidimicrobiales bacterium]